jgi:hypothetical protein
MIEAREAGDSKCEPTSMPVDVLSESIVCRPLRGLALIFLKHRYLGFRSQSLAAP